MKDIRCMLASWTVAALVILAGGCSYIAPDDTAKDLVPIKTIGVLPAQIAGHILLEGKNTAELETGVATVDAILADYFQRYPDADMISYNELAGLSLADAGNPLSLAREAGEKLHYDAVLVSSLERFQERDGSPYAVTTPASVSFSLKLLAVEKGRVIWSADFDQTQQPLLENILPKTRSTGSGFRWLTAAELTAAGLNKKLNTCPYLKRN